MYSLRMRRCESEHILHVVLYHLVATLRLSLKPSSLCPLVGSIFVSEGKTVGFVSLGGPSEKLGQLVRG